MQAILRFLSPKRFGHNVITHFSIPMLSSLLIGSIPYLPFDLGSTNLMDGLVIALTFSTAASCIRRRFKISAAYVGAAACIGLVAGCISGFGDVCYWLQLISVGICVIVSCWTSRFYLQILFVPAWFFLCFWITFLLEDFVISHGRGSFFALLMILIPFTVAPFLFLGVLPFGDENFRT